MRRRELASVYQLTIVAIECNQHPLFSVCQFHDLRITRAGAVFHNGDYLKFGASQHCHTGRGNVFVKQKTNHLDQAWTEYSASSLMHSAAKAKTACSASLVNVG